MSRAGPDIRSCLYLGRVTHRRLRPREHALSYRIFYLLIDLDEIDGWPGRLRLLSANRFNLLSFHERDHGNGRGSLRPQVDAMVREAGLHEPLGAIRVLTMPRILGHVFNPLSVYFCHARDGRLACLVYEVSNTFGERHSYVIPVSGSGGGAIRQSCAKAFYVSPFLDMALTYDFVVTPPEDRMAVAVTARDEAGPMIATALSGRRSALTDGALLRAVLSHPLLTLKVVLAIHWEALRIWLKGVGLRRRPPPPAHAMTAVVPHE